MEQEPIRGEDYDTEEEAAEKEPSPLSNGKFG